MQHKIPSQITKATAELHGGSNLESHGHPHFTDENTEAQGAKAGSLGACPRPSQDPSLPVSMGNVTPM